VTTSNDLQERLRAEWLDLVRAFGVPGAAAEQTFADLTALYSEPGRFYHTLRHLDEVLAVVGRLRAETRDLAAVRFAAWFHDAVYDPRARDNEERSADLAAAVLSAWPVPPALVAATRQLIQLTKTHQAAADDRDGLVLLDADLAILGAAPERYAEYREAIRREYAWVPEEAYRLGRRHVLEGFARRQRLYHLDVTRTAFENQARRNLAAEIAALSIP
jgi:predicted metal-dependent HD superfamily phosphohydrolase